jgi:tRNA A37 threonylcarbamoyladenosine synthetase subunit TsaC/SUA5/YrdC
LCDDVGPIATTSANLHGLPACTDAEDVRRTFGQGLAVVLDGGRCAGEPSTVVDVTGGVPMCVRAGAVAWATVAAVADRIVTGSG